MNPCALCGHRVRVRVVAHILGARKVTRALVCKDCAALGVLVISSEAADARRRPVRTPRPERSK